MTPDFVVQEAIDRNRPRPFALCVDKGDKAITYPCNVWRASWDMTLLMHSSRCSRKHWVNRLLSIFPHCASALLADTKRRGCRTITICLLLADISLSR